MSVKIAFYGLSPNANRGLNEANIIIFIFNFFKGGEGDFCLSQLTSLQFILYHVAG